jgi:membrane associated rhomboid family serine protease
VRSPVVIFLVVANVAVYLLQGTAGEYLFQHFALWPLGSYPVAGAHFTVGFEPWQLVTSAFMHDPGNIAHLLLNMFALFMFGRDVESALGSTRFAWLYFASVIAGSLAQLLVVSMNIEQGVVPTVGASGGVFGVLLAFAILFPKRRLIVFPIPLPLPAWLVVTGYAILELSNGVMGTQQGVAHFAHVGGMVGAAGVLLFLSRRPPPPRAA